MLVSSLNKITNLNMLLKYSDAVMAGCDDTSILNEQNYTIDDLLFIQNEVHKANKCFILKLNCMLHEDKIMDFKNFISNFNDVDYYYVSDLGAAEILSSLGLKDKIIYDPVTMICNSLDAKIYKNCANILGLSHEITLEDANIISEAIDNNAFYKVFGYHLMCFSKRKLISLYLEENKLTKLGDIYYLNEEKREDYYPIIERNYGTLILRSHVINLMKEIQSIKPKYLFVETTLIDSDKLEVVLDLYSKLINHEISIEDALNKYNELELLTSDGFTYTDSVYLKEEMKNV